MKNVMKMRKNRVICAKSGLLRGFTCANLLPFFPFSVRLFSEIFKQSGLFGCSFGGFAGEHAWEIKQNPWSLVKSTFENTKNSSNILAENVTKQVLLT